MIVITKTSANPIYVVIDSIDGQKAFRPKYEPGSDVQTEDVGWFFLIVFLSWEPLTDRLFQPFRESEQSFVYLSYFKII